MKIRIDDIRNAPEGYLWCKSVLEATETISENGDSIESIDLDHDAGDYSDLGGDYINILKALEELYGTDTQGLWSERCKGYLFRFHSMNPVGVQNMRNILHANGRREI